MPELTAEDVQKAVADAIAQSPPPAVVPGGVPAVQTVREPVKPAASTEADYEVLLGEPLGADVVRHLSPAELRVYEIAHPTWREDLELKAAASVAFQEGEEQRQRQVAADKIAARMNKDEDYAMGAIVARGMLEKWQSLSPVQKVVDAAVVFAGMSSTDAAEIGWRPEHTADVNALVERLRPIPAGEQGGFEMPDGKRYTFAPDGRDKVESFSGWSV